MKRMIYALCLFTLLASGCKVAEKEFRKGNYDDAIDICVKRLIDNPDKAEYIQILEESFRRANDGDLAAIKALHTDGNPDRWSTVYDIYQTIYVRQEKIKPLLPLYLGTEERDAEFKFVDAVGELNNAKKNAAAYWYALGDEKMKSGDMHQARDAYYEYEKIYRYYSTYKDLDAKVAAAREKGMAQALFVLTNESSGNYNYDVQQAINRFKVYEDNGNWFRLYNAYDPKEADFTVELVVRTIEAYPDKVTTNRYEETKEIQDGFEFLYDAQGHIVKDSLGNPIKVPDYKTVSVFVTETWQEKIATMSGEILYKDASGRVMRSIPVRSDAVFQNYYATATGYYEALSPQSKQKIGGQPIPFPSENTLLLDAVKQMECNVNDVLEDYNDEYLNR